MIRRVYGVRESATAPLQSNFRVAAVFVYTDKEGNQAVMDGSNNETCFIHGSICAERSALPRIRMAGYTSIDAVYITCDGEGYITPGMLCREYMTEICPLDLRVVLASGGNTQGPDGVIPNSVRITTLLDLYPFPPAYRNLSRYDVLDHAQGLGSRVEAWDLSKDGNLDSDDEQDEGDAQDGGDQVAPCLVRVGEEISVGPKDLLDLLRATRKETERDARDILHPIRYAGGVLFSNGEIHTGCQTKALEYGATVNPFIKLAKVLEDGDRDGKTPIALVMMDQFSVLHGPMADSRAFLHEGSWGSVPVLLHDTLQNGILVASTVSELIPDSPRIEELFTDVDSRASSLDLAGQDSGGAGHRAELPHVPGVERQNTLHNMLGSQGSV